jgi:hypothetical protein
MFDLRKILEGAVTNARQPKPVATTKAMSYQEKMARERQANPIAFDKKYTTSTSRPVAQPIDYRKDEYGKSNFLERLMNPAAIENRAKIREQNKANSELFRTNPVQARLNIQDTIKLADENSNQSRIDTANINSSNFLHNMSTAGSKVLGEGLGNLAFGADQTPDKLDIKDVGRFLVNLPGGMASVATSTPSNISRAITGKGIDEYGQKQDLTGWQRAGSGLTAGIDVVGTFLGGSGTLLKGVLQKSGKEILKQGGKQGIKQLFKKLGMDAGEEALEEGAQYVTGILSRDGNLDNFDPLELGKTMALGAAGGLVMSGGGKVIGSAKTGGKNLANKVTTNLVTNKQSNLIAGNPKIIAPNYNTDMNEAFTMNDYVAYKNPSDPYLKGWKPGDFNAINNLSEDIRTIGRKADMDFITGTPAEIKQRNDMYQAGRQEAIAERNRPAETKVRQLTPEQVKNRTKREREAGFMRIGFPDAKNLPQDMKSRLENSMNFSNKTSVADRITNNKLTPRDVDNIAPLNQFKQADFKTLADNIPEFKKNPVMTFNPNGKVPGLNYTVPTFEYNVNGQKMTFAAESLLPVESDLSVYKAGEQVDFSQAIQKGNNKIPVITESKPGKKLPVDTPTPQVSKTEVPAITPTKPKVELPIVGKPITNKNQAKAKAVESKPAQVKQVKSETQTTPQSELPKTVKAKIDKLVSSSKLTPNAYNDALNTPLSQVLGDIKTESAPVLPTFNAVAASGKSNSGRKLTTAINNSPTITQAAIDAQQTGKELNFFAKKDANDRSVGIERFDPKTHKIEAGFVTDINGNILGNHIKVDNTGIQVNVGGDLVNLESIIGNPNDWKGKYRPSETMSRNIDANAPNKQVAQQAKDYLVGSKVKAEANFRTELQKEYGNLSNRIKTVEDARPKNVSKDVYNDDIFAVLNGDKTDAVIRSTYDAKTANSILDYKTQTRKLYDSLLDRINKERVKFGKEPIEARQNYITHLQEMSNSKAFVGEVAQNIKNSFADEGMQTTRGGVPTQIAGRTEGFQPIQSWNKFLQRRKGTKSLRDPFLAVQEYLEPALYNIHMTEPTARARAVESAFRTAGELRDMDANQFTREMDSFVTPYKKGNATKLVTGFQEYANALAKKTQRLDRVIIDSSDAAATAMKGWQGLQRIGGRGTILGNVSSVLAQPLNIPITIADVGVKNYMKGIAATIGGDTAINQSPFITARRTKANKPIRGIGTRIMDAGAIPLEKIEMASIETIWNANHAKAKANGYTGTQAIKQADFNTERLVAGRGIGDRPELYRSTFANGLLQYTLEVNAQNKVFMKDLNAGQKAKFMVAALATNTLMGAITGFEPLPDFLKAALDTGADLLDEEDDRNVGEKLLGGAKRTAGEYVKMNPIASVAANTFMTKEQRKDFFGSESDVARFEGTAAPIKVVQNAYSAAKNAIEGNWAKARDDALRVVPFGNQARKSISGFEANMRGYAVDSSGRPTYATSTGIVSQVKNVLFGPSSDPNARKYYDNNNVSLSQSQTDILKTLEKSEQLDYLKSITERRANDKQTDKELARLEKSSGETKKLSTGKIAYKSLNGEWKTADDQASADKAIARDKKAKLLKDFEESDKNYEMKDGIVYRRKEDGTAYTTPQNKFEYSVGKEQLQSYKANENLNAWVDTASKQVDRINEQLNDPNIDPLDKIALENDAMTLISQIVKYKSYGGFTKPKAAKKTKSNTRLDYTKGVESSYSDMVKNRNAVRNLLSNISIKRRKI